MTRTTEPVAALAAVERLLRRHLAQQQAKYRALLNTLLAEAEAPPVRQDVIDELGHQLHALLISAGADKAASKLPGRLDRLTAAVDLMACAPAPSDEEPQQRTYSFGKSLADRIVHLHDDLGLSVLFIHKHLCKWHGMTDTLPEVEFLRCIACVIQAPRYP